MKAIEFVRQYAKDANLQVEDLPDDVYDVSDMEFWNLRDITVFQEQEIQPYLDRQAEHLRNYWRDYKTPEALNQIVSRNLDAIRAKIVTSDEMEIKIKSFLSESKECAIGQAYEREDCFLFNKIPQKFSGTILGDGFEGHGTTAILSFTNPLPKAILILGEND